MRLDELIKVLQHTAQTLPGDTPVCFTHGHGEDKQVFDYGEKGRVNYSCCVTIMETHAHVDGFGRFHIPIREIKEERRPMRLRETPEDRQWFINHKRWVHEQFTQGHTDLPQGV